jgi:Zn-dependent M28 family amino/carboxypeptidase
MLSCFPLAIAAVYTLGCSSATAGGEVHGGVPSSTSGSTVPAETSRPAFDGPRAFKLLKEQCDFGPRPVGSSAHAKTREWLMAEMAKVADKTVAQDFKYKGLPLTNVIGVINPNAAKKVLLCAHWDTRPRADMEIDPAKRRLPIIGASDGASGVAVLLELGRMFKEKRPDIGVVLVFLDGEDYGDFQRDEGVFLGSRYFAKNHSGYDVEYGILLDMVGDRDLNIYREVNSQQYAAHVNDKVFRAAKELGYGNKIIDSLKTDVSDDHIPLNEAKIPTIDLIDFDYAPWHTVDDTPDKCSAESLKAVGETIAEVVYREKL